MQPGGHGGDDIADPARSDAMPGRDIRLPIAAGVFAVNLEIALMLRAPRLFLVPEGDGIVQGFKRFAGAVPHL